jgi:hypothetical protein
MQAHASLLNRLRVERLPKPAATHHYRIDHTTEWPLVGSDPLSGERRTATPQLMSHACSLPRKQRNKGAQTGVAGEA